MNRSPVPWILLLILLAGGRRERLPEAPAAEHCHVWKLQSVFLDPIADPEQWAADNFSDTPNAVKQDWKIDRFELDLDRDGVPELFLTTPACRAAVADPT